MKSFRKQVLQTQEQQKIQRQEQSFREEKNMVQALKLLESSSRQSTVTTVADPRIATDRRPLLSGSPYNLPASQRSMVRNTGDGSAAAGIQADMHRSRMQRLQPSSMPVHSGGGRRR